MPEKIRSPEKIRERMKYVMRDLDRDVKHALNKSKKKKKGKKSEKEKRNSTGNNNNQYDGEEYDDMTEEEKADLERMELEEKALKEKRRAERRAALKGKLHFGTYTKEHITHMRKTYRDMDADGSGSVDLDEFLLQQDQSHMSDHMASMFHAMDQDGDGNVSLGRGVGLICFMNICRL